MRTLHMRFYDQFKKITEKHVQAIWSVIHRAEKHGFSRNLFLIKFKNSVLPLQMLEFNYLIESFAKCDTFLQLN